MPGEGGRDRGREIGRERGAVLSVLALSAFSALPGPAAATRRPGFSAFLIFSNLSAWPVWSSTSPRTVDVCRVGLETRPGSTDELETELAAVLEEEREEEKDEAGEVEDERDVETGTDAVAEAAAADGAGVLALALGRTNTGVLEGTTMVESRDSGAFGPCVLSWRPAPGTCPRPAEVDAADEAFVGAPAASGW